MKSRCHILVIFLVKRSSVLKKKIFFRVINFEEDYRLKIMHNFFFQIRLFIIDIPFYFYKYVVGKTFLYYNILPFDKLLLGDSWDSKTLKWLPTLTQKCSAPSSSTTWVENDFFYNFAWCCCVGIPHTVAIS